MDKRFTDLLASCLPLLGGRTLTEDTDLREVGMDSMQAVELLFGVEEAFHVQLEDDFLNDTTFATAGTLWQVVHTALEAKRLGANSE